MNTTRMSETTMFKLEIESEVAFNELLPQLKIELAENVWGFSGFVSAVKETIQLAFFFCFYKHIYESCTNNSRNFFSPSGKHLFTTILP